MAITKTITKVSVKESSGNKKITFNVSALDNGVEFDAKDFSIDYNKNDDVGEKTKELQEKIQKFMNDAVEDRTYFNSGALDGAVAWLNSNVTP